MNALQQWLEGQALELGSEQHFRWPHKVCGVHPISEDLYDNLVAPQGVK